jgi:hypothetical protein
MHLRTIFKKLEVRRHGAFNLLLYNFLKHCPIVLHIYDNRKNLPRFSGGRILAEIGVGDNKGH